MLAGATLTLKWLDNASVKAGADGCAARPAGSCRDGGGEVEMCYLCGKTLGALVGDALVAGCWSFVRQQCRGQHCRSRCGA